MIGLLAHSEVGIWDLRMKQPGPYKCCKALSLSALALFWPSQVRMVEMAEWILSGFITRLIPVGNRSKPCKALV